MIPHASPKLHPSRVKHGKRANNGNTYRKNNSLSMFHPFPRSPSRAARTRRGARVREGWGERVNHGSFPAEAALDGRGNSSRGRQSLLRGTDVPVGRNGARWGPPWATRAPRLVRRYRPAACVATRRTRGRDVGDGLASTASGAPQAAFMGMTASERAERWIGQSECGWSAGGACSAE